MANPGQLALIHAEIDGELDAGQRAELSRTLLADPKARELRDGLRQLCQTLDAVPLVDPPPGLQDNILAAMPQIAPLSRRRQGRPRLAAWRRASTRQASTIAAWRYAALLAGVLVAGGVIFQLMKSPYPPPSELAGTIAPDPTAMLVDTAQISGGSVSGHVSLYRDRAALTLRFEVAPGAPIDARVSSEGHILQIVGVTRGGGPASTGVLGVPAATALPGVAMHGQDITVTFISGGHPVGAATLRAPGGP
jgi:hypothetical protein